MRLDDFDYDLPSNRIAQVPIEPRDAARLLIDRGAGPPDDGHIGDLVEELRPGDLVVVNDTKVIPARLRLARHSGGAAEVLLLEPVDATYSTWEALVRPGKKLKNGEVLLGALGAPTVKVGPRTSRGDTFFVDIIGAADGTDLAGLVDEVLIDVGEMPLPPYIEHQVVDPDRYQTVYAKHPGSAAAPTAGLHLTSEIFEALADRGIGCAEVELVVGLDTFRPIDSADPLRHQMHSERYRVPNSVMSRCDEVRRSGGRVVAVGTTSVRALESAATSGEMHGRSNLFIYRGYDWKVVDMMMTNFHMPRTTLLMMIDGFVGGRWRDLYEHALGSDGLVPPYRFLSFGDAMLLDRQLG